MSVDHRTVAAIALSGTALNLLGGLYLAYDLFGGKHGPLRTLTRAVTYGVLFFLGYTVFLPISFSVLAAHSGLAARSRSSLRAPRAALVRLESPRRSRVPRAVPATASAAGCCSAGALPCASAC